MSTHSPLVRRLLLPTATYYHGVVDVTDEHAVQSYAFLCSAGRPDQQAQWAELGVTLGVCVPLVNSMQPYLYLLDTPQASAKDASDHFALLFKWLRVGRAFGIISGANLRAFGADRRRRLHFTLLIEASVGLMTVSTESGFLSGFDVSLPTF